MADKGDVRMRVIVELALAAETGGGIEPAVQAAYLAGVEPYEIAELGGLPMRGVLVTVGESAACLLSRLGVVGGVVGVWPAGRR